MNSETTTKRITSTALILLVAMTMGVFTTSQYIKARNFSYETLEQGCQFERHQAVLNGKAGNPWQYRVLVPYMVEGISKVFNYFHWPHSYAVSFVVLRGLQDTLIFLLSFAYYRALNLSWSHALIGVLLLAWGISYSYYDGDLLFNTFFDVIFYLLAGLCILHGKYVWIVPITLLASLNRETCGLIPVMLLSVAWFALPLGSVRRLAPLIITAFVIYLVVFIGIRMVFPKQELIIAYNHHPGYELLRYNLTRPVTWQQLLATLNVIPLVALLGYKKWPRSLRLFFWTIVPSWVLIHAFGAIMAEARTFLVPQAMVFIPGLLYLAQQSSEPDYAFRRERVPVP